MSQDRFSVTTLHQIALGCADLERSIAFYHDKLGATHIATFDPPGLAFFDLGSTRLLLERTADPAPGTATLYFHVPDLDGAYAHLVTQGVAFDSEPQLIHLDSDGTFGAAGEQEWMAFFRDPDGNSLALASRRWSAPKGQ